MARIISVQIPWQSPCKRAYIEDRNGLLWCWLDTEHVGTQLHLAAAIKLVERKLSLSRAKDMEAGNG